MILRARSHLLSFPRPPLVMGIVNLSADSFSGDGLSDCGAALAHAERLLADGADIIDVGAESARTNRSAITPAEELHRILPFLEGFPTACAAASTVPSAANATKNNRCRSGVQP